MVSTFFQRLWLAGGLTLLVCSTGPGFAQGYIGAGIGLTTVDLCDDLRAASPGIRDCDDEDKGLKVFGGYEFTPNFAVEGAWIDLGEASVSGFGGSATGEVDGFQLAAVGIFPINPQFDIFGKVGAYKWDSSVNSSSGASVSDDGTDLMFGAGVMWNFTPQLGLRGEWERFDIDGDDVDFLSVGIQLNF